MKGGLNSSQIKEMNWKYFASKDSLKKSIRMIMIKISDLLLRDLTCFALTFATLSGMSSSPHFTDE